MINESSISSDEKNISLWQISHDLQLLLQQLYDEETGEINADIEQQINLLCPSFEKKCIAVGEFIKFCERQQRLLEMELKEKNERHSAFGNKINRNKEYLVSEMQRCGKKKIIGTEFTLNVSPLQDLTEIENFSLIPREFIRVKEITKIEESPDKNAIKQYFKDFGMCVPGTKIIQNRFKVDIKHDKI